VGETHKKMLFADELPDCKSQKWITHLKTGWSKATLPKTDLDVDEAQSTIIIPVRVSKEGPKELPEAGLNKSLSRRNNHH